MIFGLVSPFNFFKFSSFLPVSDSSSFQFFTPISISTPHFFTPQLTSYLSPPLVLPLALLYPPFLLLLSLCFLHIYFLNTFSSFLHSVFLSFLLCLPKFSPVLLFPSFECFPPLPFLHISSPPFAFSLFSFLLSVSLSHFFSRALSDA